MKILNSKVTILLYDYYKKNTLFVSHLTQGPAKRPHFQLRSNSVRGDPSSEQSKIVLKSALKKSNTSAEILTDAASRRERSKFLSCQCLDLKFNGILGKN